MCAKETSVVTGAALVLRALGDHLFSLHKNPFFWGSISWWIACTYGHIPYLNFKIMLIAQQRLYPVRVMPFFLKVFTSTNINRVQWPACVLAWHLGNIFITHGFLMRSGNKTNGARCLLGPVCLGGKWEPSCEFLPWLGIVALLPMLTPVQHLGLPADFVSN